MTEEERRLRCGCYPGGPVCRICQLAGGAGPATAAAHPGPCRHFQDHPTHPEDLSRFPGCIRKRRYGCDLYGTCTPAGEFPGVMRCDACPHRQPISDAPDHSPRKLLLTCDLCPGDVTVMTAAVESLHRAHPGKFITAVRTTAPELWHFNPRVVAAEGDGWQVVPMHYPLINESDQRAVHFMQGYCDWLASRLGIPVPLLVNRPQIYLSAEERGWIGQVHETHPGLRYWIVNAGHKADYTAKWWGTANYQAVVDKLRGRVQFVQIGEANHHHPQLDGAIDLRGKTSIRQLVRLVYHADGGLGPSTFLQHLCAALEKPYVLIAGGREPRSWQTYPRQTMFSAVGSLPCCAARACWRSRVVALGDGSQQDGSLCELPVRDRAGVQIPTCLDLITPEEVVAAVERYAVRQAA